ncbi:hypothetical protein THAOC_27532, partial [Thalassiosira oceanica]
SPVLAPLWEGRESAVCPADGHAVSTAAAECAAHLLLRRPRGRGGGERGGFVRRRGRVPRRACRGTSARPGEGGGSSQGEAEDAARDALARDLNKLDVPPAGPLRGGSTAPARPSGGRPAAAAVRRGSFVAGALPVAREAGRTHTTINYMYERSLNSDSFQLE